MSITLIGDGGHAAVIRDLIRARERLDRSGLIKQEQGTIIAVGDNRARKREAESRSGESWAYLIHPSATVASSALIGMGTVIMAGAVVQARACLGQHCIVNSGATVDHDCVLADFVHIAPGAHLCGSVRVGEGAMVGTGVAVAQGAELAPWTLYKARRLEAEEM